MQNESREDRIHPLKPKSGTIIMRFVHYTYPNRQPLPAFRHSPWAGLESEIDRLFQNTLGDLAGVAATRRVPVDLYEDKDNTYVRAELPGVNREDINVELADGSLNLSATRKSKTGDREENVSLNRTVSVPDAAVQPEKISAAYENGVLTVTLPKREEARPRKVTIAIK